MATAIAKFLLSVVDIFKPANDRQQGFAHKINTCNHLKDDCNALFGLLIDEPEYLERLSVTKKYQS